MATHSSVLAWRIPEMGEPGGQPSMGSHRVGHDWSDLAAAAQGLTSSDIPMTMSILGTWILVSKYHSVKLKPKTNKEVNHTHTHTNRVLWRTGLAGKSAVCAQSCLTLCNPMDSNLPGSSVHGISQARILKWVVISSPGNIPDSEIKPTSLALLHWQVDSLPLCYLGSLWGR